jgi:pilus assembly protein CpaC
MLEVASGQSFAIGGLLQNNVIRDINKVPWLSDVPILGKLFTSENFQRNETELIIIVTPYIVGPIKEEPGARVAGTPGPAAASPATPASAQNPSKPGAPGRVVGPGSFQLD